MITYMLSKLEDQIRQSLRTQIDDDLPAVLDKYEQLFEALCYYEDLGYRQETENIWRLVLEIQPTPARTLFIHGLILYYRRKYLPAGEAIRSAILLTPEVPFQYFLLARVLTALSDFSGAHTAYDRVRELAPHVYVGYEGVLYIKVAQEMPGEDYYAWLQHFHQWLQPVSYVEIGLGHGRSITLAGPNTTAIGIDPYQGGWERLNYVCPHGPATLFPLTSDDFFANHDLRMVIGQETFDLAFIDGLHLFEQVLKDFINLERYSRKDSVILIHDCLPIAPVIAKRERCTAFWTGDVWRIIPCLKTFRPDLKIMTIPAKPSGLGVITYLDAASTVLADNYDDIVRYYLSLNCPDTFEQQRVVCSVGPADEEYIKKNFCNLNNKTYAKKRGGNDEQESV